MKKSNYNIAIKNGRQRDVKQISGYIFQKDGLWFGIDHRYTYHWQITELNTGMAIGCGIPRMKDVDTVLTDEVIEKVKRAISQIDKTIFVNDIDNL